MSSEITGKLIGGEPLTNDDLIRYLPALAEVPRIQLDKFAKDAAVIRRYRKGDLVCREGEFGSTAFYIVSGRTNIFLANPLAHVKTRSAPSDTFWEKLKARMNSFLSTEDLFTEDTHRRKLIPIDDSLDFAVQEPLAELGKGELFGEAACRSYQPRSATVQAVEDCVIIEMLRVILDMLMGTREVDSETKLTTKIKLPTFKGTSFKTEMDRKYRERALATQLRSLDIFESLDEAAIQKLCTQAQLVTHPRGNIICNQGDAGDNFYVIRSGMVKVSSSVPGGELVRTYLSRGDYFGEISLLTGQPRSASCTALDTTDLVQINTADFLETVRLHPQAQAKVQSVADARLHSDVGQPPLTGLDVDEFLNQGLFEAQNLLLIDLQKCTRCDLCVTACADAHDGVSRLLRDGQRYDKYLVATACRSCRDPLCMTQCPVGSIRRRKSLEIVIEDWCIGCGKCAELCPYGNISMHPTPLSEKSPAATQTPAAIPAPKPIVAETKKATTCDLCTELATPSCVYACPHDAAMRVDPRNFFARRVPGLTASPKKLSINNRTTH